MKNNKQCSKHQAPARQYYIEKKQEEYIMSRIILVEYERDSSTPTSSSMRNYEKKRDMEVRQEVNNKFAYSPVHG